VPTRRQDDIYRGASLLASGFKAVWLDLFSVVNSTRRRKQVSNFIEELLSQTSSNSSVRGMLDWNIMHFSGAYDAVVTEFRAVGCGFTSRDVARTSVRALLLPFHQL
jgi:hypothetical protein